MDDSDAEPVLPQQNKVRAQDKAVQILHSLVWVDAEISHAEDIDAERGTGRRCV